MTHVLHISSADAKGGAAIATRRLYKGQQAQGINAQMLVYRKFTADPHTLSPGPTGIRYAWRAPFLDQLPLLLYRNRQPVSWTPAWIPSLVPAQVRRLNPDITHLHWTGSGMLNIKALTRFKQPLVWTLHDMWAFTGGCHYSGDCIRYQERCGACPQLSSARNHDLSRWVWQRKKHDWENLNLTVVAPSRWLADCASRSSLFSSSQIVVIPNGIDTQSYRPFDRALARDVFNLPKDRKLVLFGAVDSDSDPRKGFSHLRKTFNNVQDVDLVVFGNRQPLTEDWPIRVHEIGLIEDERTLALLYSAADVFVAPSQQDNLPNTIMESLACGTPCAAFNVGGISDMITHQLNGYLAAPFDADDLADGIRWILEEDERYAQLTSNARLSITEHFEIGKIVQRYHDLYNTLLLNDNRR